MTAKHTKLSIFCTKLIEAGWLAAVVAVPLFFNIYTARTFEPDKLTLLRSIVTVMLLAWLVKLLEEGGQVEAERPFGERFKAWLKQPMVLPALTILLVYIVSTALSLSPLVSLWGSYQRLQGSYTFISYMVIFAMMAMNMSSHEQVDRFVTTVILASVPVALYGIIQHNGLDPLPWAGNVTRRVASNMGNAIFVSSYMIMIVPLTVSRLVQSMAAIVTEEEASWGHTVLAAVYIFVLTVQILTIIYSLSRGPQIGLMATFALMGLLLLLVLRQRADDPRRLTLREVGTSIGVLLFVGLAALLGGGLGFLAGRGVEALLAAARLEVGGATIVGTAIGGLIGFVGMYTYLAASGRGWRWLWASWVVLAIVGGASAITFLVLLRDPQGPLQSLRRVPALSRLSGALDTSRGTGKVRVLIWEAALQLVSPHEPLGIPGDYTGGVNPIRPLVGYGPESMFNAFAFVYPPDLAHVEQRGSSADRSHNETMDSLVMTGVLGFLAFYFLMGSLFYYAIKWLGWVPDRKATMRLVGLMAFAGLAGAIIPYVLQGAFTLSVLGLPFGLFGGFFLYLCVQAFLQQPSEAKPTIPASYVLLLIGMLGAFIGHFLEVHFVFSIAATYTYFWAYLGLMVALARIGKAEAKEAAAETPPPEATEPAEETLPAQSRRRRRRRKSRVVKRPRLAAALSLDAPETWETWLGSLGLAMAIILIILTFDFVPIQFDLSTGRYSLLWMSSITFLVGTAIALSDVAVKAEGWQTPVNWGRAVMLYIVTSLGYAGFYILFHSQQRHILTTRQLDVLSGANGIVGILYGFYIALFLLMAVIALMLLQRRVRGFPFWRSTNWWLYPPLIAAAVLVIFFKNLNVVKADIYLKEGERYRNVQQWDNAILLHRESVRMDSDEDFYYLMLALDFQLKAQDGRLSPADRQQAWLEGEKIALQARDINKYNPDNTGNLGRYYFTLGQLLNPSYYDKALDYFRKAIYLAPQNVQYYNLLAQVYYIKNQFDDAIVWLEKSIELDAEFPPTWLQLGDTYAAISEVDKALDAHKQAILMNPGGFADANFDSRLNFYISANRHEDIVQAFQQYLEEHPPQNKRERRQQRKILWAIGHAYLRAGQTEKGIRYIQQAVDQGYANAVALQELANAYLTQNKLAQAEAVYQQALQQKNANQPQIYSSLGYIYAQTGRLQEAIDANNKVLESLPNDYDSHKNLALLYQQTGQIDQALTHAEAALQVAPEARKADLQTFIEQLRAQQSP